MADPLVAYAQHPGDVSLAEEPRTCDGRSIGDRHAGHATAAYICAVDRSDAANLFTLTGPPGSGKTAILDHLRAKFRCLDEPAREVLAEQRASGGRGTWDQDPSLFVDLLLRRSIEQYESARGSPEPVLFDRGVPDCVVYAMWAGTDPRPSIEAADAFRYEPQVLFLQPWSDIYTTDEERVMSFEDTLSFSDALKDVYGRAGYFLVDVPKTPVLARADFVREFMGA